MRTKDCTIAAYDPTIASLIVICFLHCEILLVLDFCFVLNLA